MTTRRQDLATTSGPTLFDLPLDCESGSADEPASAVSPEVVAVAAHLAETEPPPEAEQIELEDPFAPPAEDSDVAAHDTRLGALSPVVAGVAPRLISGCADLLIHGSVLAATTLGLYAIAATPRLDQWPALAVLLLAFSFFYTVVSLAFWGQTAGIAWCELSSRDRLSRPLSFRQATLRWCGGLASLALGGVPVLLAIRGTSLTDFLSGSVTLVEPTAD
ncbi:MAG: RDD family protein [Acidobacteriota bacterium]|nr:RDD family protein [Acidobacteriota bacterium]